MRIKREQKKHRTFFSFFLFFYNGNCIYIVIILKRTLLDPCIFILNLVSFNYGLLI